MCEECVAQAIQRDGVGGVTVSTSHGFGSAQGIDYRFFRGLTGCLEEWVQHLIRQALHDGHRGPVALVYSSRSPAEFAYLEEFRQLANEKRLSLVLTLTGPADDWAHSRGRAGAAHRTDVVKLAVRLLLS